MKNFAIIPEMFYQLSYGATGSGCQSLLTVTITIMLLLVTTTTMMMCLLLLLAFPAQARPSFTAASSRVLRRGPIQKAPWRSSCTSASQRAQKTNGRRGLFSFRAWGKDTQNGPNILRVELPRWRKAFWERRWIRSAEILVIQPF